MAERVAVPKVSPVRFNLGMKSAHYIYGIKDFSSLIYSTNLFILSHKLRQAIPPFFDRLVMIHTKLIQHADSGSMRNTEGELV